MFNSAAFMAAGTAVMLGLLKGLNYGSRFLLAEFMRTSL